LAEETAKLFETAFHAVGPGLVITAADVGGIGSRRVMLDLWSGAVWVRRNAIR
jgi:hypothetical protein